MQTIDQPVKQTTSKRIKKTSTKAANDQKQRLTPKKRKSYYVKKTVELRFTEQEDIQLLESVIKFGQNWHRISQLLSKSMIKCHKRYL